MILLLLLVLAQVEERQGALSRRLWTGPLIGAGAGLLLRWINGVRPVAAVLLIALLIWLFLLKKSPRWRLWLPLVGVLLVVYMATGRLDRPQHWPGARHHARL